MLIGFQILREAEFRMMHRMEKAFFRKFRSPGIQKFRNSEIQKSPEIQKFRSSEIQNFRNFPPYFGNTSQPEEEPKRRRRLEGQECRAQTANDAIAFLDEP
ncbi:hypothetical protein B9Z55_015330 [Caenorhabditis nigoni]|uniref:Uncharacterized protein n=1 Tax=Caenorhabditis nigoni TaxID=1611254 RepID=A0A2G5UAA0_9PELO|nr:hypothetical protein B9Z55_015330 [Caenorhabditis nigoni]